MNVERATMDGCGQQPLFLTGTSGSGGISSPQQQTVQTGAPPEHYGGPLSLSICISDSGHEILRPKPRRWVFFYFPWTQSPIHQRSSVIDIDLNEDLINGRVHGDPLALIRID